MASLTPLKLALLRALRDAVAVTGVCAGVALGVNVLRARPLPFVQRAPYALFVPCPELAGEAEAIAPDDPSIRAKGTVLVDARERAQFDAWHPSGATSVPYDFLEVPASAVRDLASSGARRVVVYGDGGDPDSGRELARELARNGIRSVAFVKGGALALHRGAP